MSLPASRFDRQRGRLDPEIGPSGQNGFTLVEVLVAVALLATIGAMVFGSLLTTTQALDAARAHAEHEQTVRRVLRLMADELTTGTRSDPAYPWIGLNGTQDGQPADTLAFLAISDGVGRGAANQSETIRVVYTRERDRLVRFSRRNLYGLTDESIDQLQLADRVKAFNVRYFDGQSRVWTDDWSAVAKAPKAVLLEITIQPTDGDLRIVREWITLGAL